MFATIMKSRSMYNRAKYKHREPHLAFKPISRAHSRHAILSSCIAAAVSREPLYLLARLVLPDGILARPGQFILVLGKSSFLAVGVACAVPLLSSHQANEAYAAHDDVLSRLAAAAHYRAFLRISDFTRAREPASVE